MRIAKLKYLAALMLASVAIFAHSVRAARKQSAARNARPAVVQVQKMPRGVAYIVDGKRTGSTTRTDILYALNQLYKQRGANVPIVVLLDPRIPIDQIWNVDGTAGKAQLVNLRYFVVDKDTQKMSEIRWGPAIPYSTNPPSQ